MSWKCNRCGTENDDLAQSCDGMCGYVRFGRLILVSLTGEEIKLNLNSSVGKALLKKVVGDDVRFVSEHQFHLKRCEENAAWLILHEPNATNPTLVNGISVGVEGTKLLAGSEITIGPDKARLRVKIKF